jgi:transposase
MKKITTIVIDLAKQVFQVAVYNKHGVLKSNKAMNVKSMMRLVHQHPEAQIITEACGSAHHFARRFIQLGHDAYLIPPHICAKYRTGNKNDKNDTVAIYEAAKNQRTYFVSVRNLIQQDIALLHKLRKGHVGQRTKVANRIRGFATEYGVSFPLGINKLRQQLPDALENADNELTDIARSSLRALLDMLLQFDVLEAKVKLQIEQLGKQLKPCKALVKIPGIGWLGATMIYARFGSGEAFKRGRDASASIGIVPSHSGSGGKNRLGSISKRGDTYLRWLIIHGARSVVNNIRDKQDGMSCWIRKQLITKHSNITTVAVANKLIRMAVAILKSGEAYRTPVAQRVS